MDILTPNSLYLFLLLSFLFTLWKIITNYPSRNSLKPPSPAALPIIGHLHLLLLTDMPHNTFTHLSKKLGPLFHLKLGRVPTLIVNSPHLARLVLKTHDHVFANRPRLISAQYLSFGCSDVTFSPYGPYWRQARRIIVAELLSGKRVQSFQLVRDEEVRRMLGGVLAWSGKEVDMSWVLFRLANDVLCRVAFGRRMVAAAAEEEEEEGQNGNRMMKVLMETQELFSGFCLVDFYPEWEWVNLVSGYKKRLMKNLEDLRVVCDEIVEDHLKKKKKKENEDEEDEKEDFVDVLLRVQGRDDLEVAISDDNLKALVLVSSPIHRKYDVASISAKLIYVT